ncbi:MAG: hypothetical protein HC866_22090 [Leptolyngbyaceae cyanobacterium RU_5_1]|nr:hypothetical protein [Leptolyngbyaceae cyanobacterium RU_5_1]
MSSHCLLPAALAELFAQVTVTRKITVADRYGMMAALCDDSIGEEELRVVNRILYALKQGRIRVVDELSATSYTLLQTEM